MGSFTESNDSIITKSFLENALQKEGKYKDSEILSYKVSMGSKPGDNYMSIIYSIELQMKLKIGDEDLLPSKRTVLIKCYPLNMNRQSFTNRTNMFFKELEVYSRWMPELERMQKEILGLGETERIKLPYAPFVHGQCIDFESEEGRQHMGRELGSLENFIMMEDIKKMYGFQMTNRRDSLDLHHMRLVISALAKVHSLSWAYKHHVERDIRGSFPCMNFNFEEEEMNMWVNVIKSALIQASDSLKEVLGHDNELSQATLNFKENGIDPVIKYFYGDKEGKQFNADIFDNVLRVKIDPKEYGRTDDYEETPWRIICHGDCWSNNMMFRYDADGKPQEVILLDLQMPTDACVTNDLQYVIYASTTAELRRNHLTSLLHLYYDEFNKNCSILKVETLPGFTFNELRYRFQRTKLLGFFLASALMPIMLKEEDKAIDLEHADKNANLEDMFKDVVQGAQNDVYSKRVLELTRELYEEGII